MYFFRYAYLTFSVKLCCSIEASIFWNDRKTNETRNGVRHPKNLPLLLLKFKVSPIATSPFSYSSSCQSRLMAPVATVSAASLQMVCVGYRHCFILRYLYKNKASDQSLEPPPFILSFWKMHTFTNSHWIWLWFIKLKTVDQWISLKELTSLCWDSPCRFKNRFLRERIGALVTSISELQSLFTYVKQVM
jgi:hypothetical protein